MNLKCRIELKHYFKYFQVALSFPYRPLLYSTQSKKPEACVHQSVLYMQYFHKKQIIKYFVCTKNSIALLKKTLELFYKFCRMVVKT